MAAVVRRIISKYDVLRTARPMVVDSLTAGTLFMSGDLLCQAIEKKKGDPYDWMRTARMTVFGVGVMGPAAYYWYHLIDRVFPSRDYSVVLRKVFLDQAVFSPPYYSTFFFIMPLLEGKSVDEAVANVKKSFVTTYIADCMLWPPVQFVCFGMRSFLGCNIHTDLLSFLYSYFFEELNDEFFPFFLMSRERFILKLSSLSVLGLFPLMDATFTLI